MNYRQVHLDFHTSEKISGIGGKFDKKEFQEALQAGYVNSITVFSKCHHGWAYHPSTANEMHPELKFDLLKAQIEAAHEIGVKTPVYLSAGLDEKVARKHPEWIVRNKDESIPWTPDFARPGYHVMCMNSPYLPYLLKQIEEVCENYDADGIFLDIVGVRACYCQNCINTLLKEGKDPYDEKNIIELGERVYANYTFEVRKAIDKHKKGLPVFHNGGHIRRGRRDLAKMNTHLELESLPTGGWGYDHFPLSAGYARTIGMEYLGMTGKFHKSWGEFGGFKHPNALRYEAALAVANGAKLSVGDQLHPNGKMDMATYTLIGEAYKEVEKIEPWLDGAENIADIAVLSSESINNYLANKGLVSVNTNKDNDIDSGCVRILLEGKYLFNVIDTEADFSDYKLLILPDNIVLDDELAQKIKEFTKNGGKVLATGKSGTYFNKDEFALDFGADFKGECKYQPSYLRPEFDIPSLLNSAYIMYSKGYDIENKSGEIIGYRENPYFNRTVFSFSSHLHTPNNPDDKHISAVIGKDGAYISWEMFNDYAKMGSITVKEFVIGVIDKLIGETKTIKTNLMAQGIVTLTKQNDRLINHILYASPVKRGENTEIIEDIIPVFNIEVSVKTDKAVKKVYKAPQMEEIPYSYNNGILSYTVDKVECSQLIVIE